MALLAVIIIVIVVVCIALYWGNNSIEICKYEIVSGKIPDEFREYKILQLSDLHSKNFGNGNAKIIDIINGIKPDIIVMTGDMVNSHESDFSVFFNLVKKLSGHKLYFVAGNNEIKMDSENRKELYKGLRDMDVAIIDNLKTEIKRGNAIVNLYGMWFGLNYYKEIHSGYDKKTVYSKVRMENDIGVCNREEFNILLTHNPLYFKAYSDWGADIILSGHVHGGIARIPGKGGLLSPERKFFPKYSEGMYKIGDSIMVVNRGLGGKPLLPRVFNKPEISVITLKQHR